MSKKYVILAEGENEQSLIASLGCKTNRVIKANCWQDDADKLRRLLRSYGRDIVIFVIFDTDILENLDRFISGIRVLSRSCSRLYLLQQKYNLEEELVFACRNITNEASLYQAFGKASKGQFKKKFNQSVNRQDTLTRYGLDTGKLWSRELINDELKYLISKKIVKASCKDILR